MTGLVCFGVSVVDCRERDALGIESEEEEEEDEEEGEEGSEEEEEEKNKAADPFAQRMDHMLTPQELLLLGGVVAWLVQGAARRSQELLLLGGVVAWLSKFGSPLDAQALTDAYLLHASKFGSPLDAQALTDAYLLHASKFGSPLDAQALTDAYLLHASKFGSPLDAQALTDAYLLHASKFGSPLDAQALTDAYLLHASKFGSPLDAQALTDAYLLHASKFGSPLDAQALTDAYLLHASKFGSPLDAQALTDAYLLHASKFGSPLDAQALTDAYLLHASKFGSPLDAQALTDAYLLHALNHVFHTRDRITKNNDKPNRASAAACKQGSRGRGKEGGGVRRRRRGKGEMASRVRRGGEREGGEKGEEMEEGGMESVLFKKGGKGGKRGRKGPGGVEVDGKELVEVECIPRDQGFTRPKVLVLLPYRNAALNVVQRLLRVTPPQSKVAVEHLDRFLAEFGEVESEEEESEEEDEEERRKARERKRRKQQQQVGRGLSWEAEEMEDGGGEGGGGSRGEGGGEGEAAAAEAAAAVLRKGLKPVDHRAMFAGNNDDHFRLGIKFTKKAVKLYTDFYQSDIIVASPIGLVTKLGEAMEDSEKDMDFLSSIEIVIVDQADVILMQNWAHVEAVFAQLNKLPVKQHGTDFMRVREWYLNGWAGHYRQSIVLSAFSHPSINALFHRSCCNFSGKVKLRSEYAGVLALVVPQVQQVFDRIDCSAITAAAEARFQFFVSTIFPRLRDSVQGGVLVYTQSYFEFVRLRNFFKQENLSFCLLSEYTDERNVHRARAWFFQNRRRIMLYSERSHFYHRYRIRGIREVIFYSLPCYPHFYAEFLNPLIGGTTRLIKASQTTPVPFPLCLVTPQTPHRSSSTLSSTCSKGGTTLIRAAPLSCPCLPYPPPPFRASLNPSSQFLNLLEWGDNAAILNLLESTDNAADRGPLKPLTCPCLP
ncbi:unnamed protein product [Closterium sp. Naga37s-1]|nr:unnamed protein product [Closterium sp. Naga37s-1]